MKRVLTIATKKFEKSFYLQVASSAQKMKFSTEDFFSKCDEIRSFLRVK